MSTDVFLSHAGEDTSAAKELAGHLRRAGLEVWLDAESLKPGDRWMEEIERSLLASRAMLVYVGRSGVERWVDNEVRVALDRNATDRNFRLIPVLGPGATPDTLPLFLRQHHWVDFRESSLDVDRLKGLIEAAGVPAEAVSLLPPDTPPYRGLLPFEAEDALLFYGRDADTEALVEKLGVSNVLTVVGDSGSGKSSLVRAGLIPALRRGRFHDGIAWVNSWRIAVMRPGNDPFRELAEALPDLDPDLSPGAKRTFLDGLRESLSEEGAGLRNAIAALVTQGTHTLVVVDQFEELFTLTPGIEDRRRFIDGLLDAAESDTERKVHIVITMRADFYARCWEHARLPDVIAANQSNVTRLGPAQLRDVIEKPLALAGAGAESHLVDTILKDVGEDTGNLPLLEHALLGLWERREGRTLTQGAYKKMGGLSGALKNHADQVYTRLASDREIARKILIRLTQPGEGAKDTRRVARKMDLLALGGDAEAAERVLLELTKSRLITVGTLSDDPGGASDPEDALRDGGESRVEVSHEALIREWPLLKQWVDENRDSLRIEHRLLQAVKEWEAKGRDSGLLMTGTRLAEANEWVSAHEGDLPQAARDFIRTSRKRARRAAVALRVLIVAVLLGAVGSGWLFYSRN